MRIEKVNDNKLKISFTSQELKENNLTFNTILED